MAAAAVGLKVQAGAVDITVEAEEVAEEVVAAVVVTAAIAGVDPVTVDGVVLRTDNSSQRSKLVSRSHMIRLGRNQNRLQFQRSNRQESLPPSRVHQRSKEHGVPVQPLLRHPSRRLRRPLLQPSQHRERQANSPNQKMWHLLQRQTPWTSALLPKTIQLRLGLRHLLIPNRLDPPSLQVVTYGRRRGRRI